MGFFSNPTSYRLNAIACNGVGPSIADSTISSFSLGIARRAVNDHESHPALGHLILLVFEAVMEVVCVSLPGYIVARQGLLDADKQKFMAEMNVMLFTPALSMWFRFLLLHDADWCSLHQIGQTIERRQVAGISCHSSYLHCPNNSLVCCFAPRLERIWLRKETLKLCDCYGSKSADPLCLSNANNTRSSETRTPFQSRSSFRYHKR